MFKLLLLGIVAAVIVGSGMFFHVIPKPSLTALKQHLPVAKQNTETKSLDELVGSTSSGEVKHEASESSDPVPAQTGKVAGISTEKMGAVAGTLAQGGSKVAAAVSSALNSPDGKGQVTIDVQGISDQIGAQMEKLPAELVQKAKVAYCQQVLTDATRSATTH